MQANRPMCHKKHNVQKGSSAEGPLGKLARLLFIEAKKAWVRPLPSVRGMPAGREEGMIQPTKARMRMLRSSLYGTPSEISNSIRGVLEVDVVAGRRMTREPTKVERIAKDGNWGGRAELVLKAVGVQVEERGVLCGNTGEMRLVLTWTRSACRAGDAGSGGDERSGGYEGHCCERRWFCDAGDVGVEDDCSRWA